MDPSDLRPMFQQMGELLGSVSALHDKADFRQLQAEKASDLLQAELRNVKHDQRDLEQKLDSAVYLLRQDVDTLKLSVGATTRSVEDMHAGMETLRKPVEEMVALRARAMGVLLAISTLGSALLYFIGPLYRWAVEHLTLN